MSVAPVGVEEEEAPVVVERDRDKDRDRDRDRGGYVEVGQVTYLEEVWLCRAAVGAV